MPKFVLRSVYLAILLLPLAVPADNLTVDLKDPVARTEFMLTLLARHPRLHALNSTFNRSVPNLYSHVKLLAETLGLPASVFVIEPKPVVGISYFEDGDAVRFDEDALEIIRKELTRRAGGLFEVLAKEKRSLKLSTLDSDLMTFPANTPDGVFYLLPLLYEDGGHSRFDDLADEVDQAKIFRSIEKISGTELQLLFSARLKKAQTVASPHNRDRLQSILNNFLPKVVLPNLIPRTPTGEITKPQKLSLEEVPPLVALIRAAVGIDCSMFSVAYHALVKGAKVYWIRNSHSLTDSPLGYVIALPATYKGGEIPFVLTVNGPGVKPAMINPLLDFVAQLWRAPVVAFPTTQDLRATMNYADLQQAMLKAKTLDGELKPANSDWYALDRDLKLRGQMTYRNYYVSHGNQALPAFFRKPARTFALQGLGLSTAYQPPDFAKFTRVQKARLAARLTRFVTPTSELFQTTTQILDLDRQAVVFARKLEVANHRANLKETELVQAVEALNIQPIELMPIMTTRAIALGLKRAMYTNAYLSVNPPWVELIEALVKRMDKEIVSLTERGQVTQAASLKRLRTIVKREKGDALGWTDLEDVIDPEAFEKVVVYQMPLLIKSNWTDLFWQRLTEYTFQDNDLAVKVLNLALQTSDDFGYREAAVTKLIRDLPAESLLTPKAVAKWRDLYNNDLDEEIAKVFKAEFEAKGIWQNDLFIIRRIPRIRWTTASPEPREGLVKRLFRNCADLLGRFF